MGANIFTETKHLQDARRDVELNIIELGEQLTQAQALRSDIDINLAKLKGKQEV